METLNTVIEFVSSGTGGGGGTGAGDAANAAATATGSSATADPLFTIIAVLVAIAAIGISLFVYARRNKLVNASAMAVHARPSVNSQCWYGNNLSRSTKILIATICIIVAATCFAICGHNNALAQESSQSSNGIATISDKVQANVDDAGAVTFDKGIITNNDGELSIGVRQVTSESDIDLSDATLTIMCNDQELFNKTIGEVQLNDKYVTVPVEDSAELTYTINMPAVKAKSLAGTQPITLHTDVDLVVSKAGSITNAGGTGIANAKVEYSYPDPYSEGQEVSGTVYTGDDGTYTIPDIKQGQTVHVNITYTDDKGNEYTKTDDIKFSDQNPLPEEKPKTDPSINHFDFTPPENLEYNAETKVAKLTGNDTCPTGMTGNIEYSTDGENWDATPKDAGEYYVRIKIDGTGKDWNSATLTDSENWNFTIKKVKLKISGSTASDKTYDGNKNATVQPGTLSGKVGSEAVSVTATGTFANKDVSDSAINVTAHYTLLGDPSVTKNYTEPRDETLSANINKATINVTPTAGQHKTYDGSTASEITYGSTQSVGSEKPAFTGALKLAGDSAPVDAGTYKIVKGNLALAEDTASGFKASNYTLTVDETVVYTINKATITVTPKLNQSKTYNGETASGITYTSEGAATGETAAFTGVLKLEGATAPVDVGTYKIVNDSLALTDSTGFKASNYTLTVVETVNYTINKATITVTPESGQSKPYDGSTASGIKYGYTGQATGETPEFTGNLKLGGNPEPVNAGTYKIVKGDLALANHETSGFKAANYILTVDENVDYVINKKIEGVSITLSSESGRCKPDATTEFSVMNAAGFGGESVSYTPTSSQTSTATVTVKTGTENPYPTYIVTGVTEGSATITVTAESINYKATAQYAITVSNKDLYSGTVKLFSDTDTTGTGLGEASVSFTEYGASTETETVTSSSEEGKRGIFTFTKVEERTAGTIKVKYTDSEHVDDVYSVAKKVTTDESGANQGVFEIRKLTSLAVTVKSSTSLDSHWCPAFADGALTKNTVKFYDKSFCETDGTATAGQTTDYKMSDLKDGGWYYAFVTTGVTLHCYQTTNALWDNAFKFFSESTSYPQTADTLQDNFIADYCSDPNAKTVYFNGTAEEKQQWAPTTGQQPTGTPSLYGVPYSSKASNGGWYDAYAAALSNSSGIPCSAVAVSADRVPYWQVSSETWGLDVDRREIQFGVVLSRAFSNATFGVSVEEPASEYGSITTKGSLEDIPYGTNYAVSGNTITIKTGASSEPSITYEQDTAGKYKLKNWEVSTDGGTTWTALTDGSTYSITANTWFRAVTESATVYYSGVVKAIDLPEASAVEKDGIKVKFTPTDTTISPVEVITADGGKYTLTGIKANTAGELKVVEGPEGTPYSAETTSIESGHVATLETITTRKLTSLQTTISDGTTGSLTSRSTCWCPVIPDDAALSTVNIKFYDYDRELISDTRGDSTEGYSMKDIASTTKSEGSGKAYKTQANYFAFCNTGQTINCFQTVGMPWTEAFNGPESGGVATELKIDDIKSRVTSCNNTFRTVYKDDEGNWVKDWGENVYEQGTQPYPYCLGYLYTRLMETKPTNNLADIYGNLIFTGASTYDGSGILCSKSCDPWSSRKFSSTSSCFWPASCGSWTSEVCSTLSAVVVQQTFS